MTDHPSAPSRPSATCATFRKKPVVIEAMRLPMEDEDASDALLAWLNAGECDYESEQGGTLLIHTLEGEMVGNPGDWIIKGIKGEFYPCKPDIFAATYEPTTQPLAPPVTAAPPWYSMADVLYGDLSKDLPGDKPTKAEPVTAATPDADEDDLGACEGCEYQFRQDDFRGITADDVYLCRECYYAVPVTPPRAEPVTAAPPTNPLGEALARKGLSDLRPVADELLRKMRDGTPGLEAEPLTAAETPRQEQS